MTPPPLHKPLFPFIFHFLPHKIDLHLLSSTSCHCPLSPTPAILPLTSPAPATLPLTFPAPATLSPGRPGEGESGIIEPLLCLRYVGPATKEHMTGVVFSVVPTLLPCCTVQG